MMLLARQLYTACQFVHCMRMSDTKFTQKDLITFLDTVK